MYYYSQFAYLLIALLTFALIFQDDLFFVSTKQPSTSGQLHRKPFLRGTRDTQCIYKIPWILLMGGGNHQNNPYHQQNNNNTKPTVASSVFRRGSTAMNDFRRRSSSYGREAYASAALARARKKRRYNYVSSAERRIDRAMALADAVVTGFPLPEEAERIVDGLDGPMARRYHVKKHAPEFDGVLLDLIIDYLTYVFIPAFALFKSGLMDGWTGWFAIIVITFTSALYFADTRMKTRDNSFSGFPGCWNMLVIVIFAVEPNFWVSLALVTVLAVAMFLPIKFIHPVRTERWRAVSLPMAVAWTFFAGWAAWVDFHPESWAHWGLVATSAYLLVAGAAQQLIYREKL